MPQHKCAAILTVHNAVDMTKRGRKQIADWLRRQAKDLVEYGDVYNKRCICRYQYVSKEKSNASTA